MEIQQALKETGKARFIGHNETYHHVGSHNDRPDGKLRWFDIRDVCLAGEVLLPDLLSDNWQPYHAKEEIRPQEAGESWSFTDEGGSYPFFTTEAGEAFPLRNQLLIRNKSGLAIKIEGMHLGEIIHNKNGWKRQHPTVPDENEIVIKWVEWEKTSDGSIFPYTRTGKPKGFMWGDLENKPPMTMKLSWKEDK